MTTNPTTRKISGREEIDQTITWLREEWPDQKLWELAPLAPYLEEKLALTRREGMRQSDVANDSD